MNKILGGRANNTSKKARGSVGGEMGNIIALARAGRTAGRDTAPGGQADQVQRSQPAAISGLRSLVGDTGRS